MRCSIFLVALILAALTIGDARASCTCGCVDGQPQAICQGTTGLKPICLTQNCSSPTPKIAPVLQSNPLFANTPNCAKQQVLNPVTHQYDSLKVCR